MKVQVISNATGSPFAQFTPAPDSKARVVYVGQDSHIHELRLEANGWFHADLSALTQAPGATGSPFAYTPFGAIPRVLYVGQDSHIHEFRLEANGWFHADLTGVVSATFDLLVTDSGLLTSDHPLGGSLRVVINKAGDFDFQASAHDSGFDNINYTVSAVLMTPSGFAFTFQHSGHVEGTIAGLPFGTPNRDDHFVAPSGNNPLIATHWNEILQADFQASLAGTDTLVNGIEGALGDLVVAAAKEIGTAGAKALVALVV